MLGRGGSDGGTLELDPKRSPAQRLCAGFWISSSPCRLLKVTRSLENLSSGEKRAAKSGGGRA